jgi:hypothetical protein
MAERFGFALHGFSLAPLKIEGAPVPFDSEFSVEERPADEDYITLATGKRLYANLGIVGLSPDGYAYGGYDGDLDDGDLSPEERREIATMMIARWREYGGI